MRHNLPKYPRKSKFKTITITDWKQMVRTITYAMYVQNSIFFQFSEKWNNEIFPFLILFIVVVIVFSDTFVFWYRHRKIDNVEMVNQFTRQKTSLCYLIMPSRKFKMTQCLKVTAPTCRKVGVSDPLAPMNFVIP